MWLCRRLLMATWRLNFSSPSPLERSQKHHRGGGCTNSPIWPGGLQLIVTKPIGFLTIQSPWQEVAHNKDFTLGFRNSLRGPVKRHCWVLSVKTDWWLQCLKCEPEPHPGATPAASAAGYRVLTSDSFTGPLPVRWKVYFSGWTWGWDAM